MQPHPAAHPNYPLIRKYPPPPPHTGLWHCQRFHIRGSSHSKHSGSCGRNASAKRPHPLGGYICPSSEIQNQSIRVLRRKPCRSQYFTIVFVLFSVTVTVSTHLCVIYCQFCCLMSLFQGHVACWNFTLTG